MPSTPLFTAEQMRQVHHVMIEDVGVALLQMMEYAGRGLARLARERFLNGDPAGKSALVLAGSGATEAGHLPQPGTCATGASPPRSSSCPQGGNRRWPTGTRCIGSLRVRSSVYGDAFPKTR